MYPDPVMNQINAYEQQHSAPNILLNQNIPYEHQHRFNTPNNLLNQLQAPAYDSSYTNSIQIPTIDPNVNQYTTPGLFQQHQQLQQLQGFQQNQPMDLFNRMNVQQQIMNPNTNLTGNQFILCIFYNYIYFALIFKHLIL